VGLQYHVKNKSCKTATIECEYCDNKFTTVANMQRHKKNSCKEKDKYIDTREKQQICELLEKIQKDNIESKKEIVKSKKEIVKSKKEIVKLKKEVNLLKYNIQINSSNSTNVIYKAPKRKTIPANIKMNIWKDAYGDLLEPLCKCCSINRIDMLSCEYSHKIAHSKGGTVESENIIPLCHTCNHKMGDIDYDEYKDVLYRSTQKHRSETAKLAGTKKKNTLKVSKNVSK
jgi:5-methylcytosine-specific restriction endonuclease McrA